MSSTSVKLISECFFVKPLNDLSPEAKQPIHFTPFELPYLNIRYSQKDLLFAKPPLAENQHFSITTFLDDLQHSLSATLTHFYPFAARFATRKQENPPSYVIYLDPGSTPGVKFIYATIDATVSDILNPTDVPLFVHPFR
ncbi:putative transferase [Helianthus annuus]|nr:putative transferase [Helianthus annuus]